MGGNTYKSNVFSGANSIMGGVADIRNNVESVFLPVGVSGAFTVKVTETNIAGDGEPGNGTPLDQDFALVINNGTEGGGSGITLTATVQQKIGQSRVNLDWNPADGGRSMSCEITRSFKPQQTMGTPRTRLEPTPEHSPTRCVRRILATARMKWMSQSHSDRPQS